MDILKSGSVKNPMSEGLAKSAKNAPSKGVVGSSVPQREDIKEFSAKTLLDSLFKDLVTNTKSKDMVLQTLQDKNIQSSIKDTSAELKSITDSLKESNLSTKSLDELLLNVNKLDDKSLQTQIKQSGIFLESKLANANISKTLLSDSLQQTLQSIKSFFNEQNLKIDTTLIDKILNAKVADKNFINDIKNLISTLKLDTNESLVRTTAKLDNLLRNSQILESKLVNSIEVLDKDIQNFAKNIEKVLNEIEVNSPKIQEIVGGLKSFLAASQNLRIDISSVGEKLQQVANLLKSELAIKLPNSQLHVEASKLSLKFENDIGSAIKSREIAPNQMLQTLQNPKDDIAKDIKANLLQVKDELRMSGDKVAKDMMPKIDRVLTNISYYQLLSYSMGANVLYLPLLWDGLEEGQVSIKKLKQNRYFCEINLKLKEFGKIDLLIMLFDDVHINISMFTQSSEFLSRIRGSLQLLRQGISSLSLIPSNIYLYDSLKDDRVKKETKEYVQTQQIGVGISIHV